MVEASALRAMIRAGEYQMGTETFDWAVARIYEVERMAEAITSNFEEEFRGEARSRQSIG